MPSQGISHGHQPAIARPATIALATGAGRISRSRTRPGHARGLGDHPRRPGDTRSSRLPATIWAAELGARDRTRLVAVTYEPGFVTLA